MTLKQNLNKSKMGEQRNRIKSFCRRPEEDRQGPAHSTAAVSWLLLLRRTAGPTSEVQEVKLNSQDTYLSSCIYKLKMIFLSIYCDQFCESYRKKGNHVS